MKFLNRRRFVATGSVVAVGAVLAACGNEPLSDEELNPTQIPDVPGAPPTLAPITATPGASTGDSGDAGTDEGTATPEALVIETHDNFSFSPNDVEVSPGQVIQVHNTGFLPHDLVVDDWGVKTEQLSTDDIGEITVPDDAEIGSKVEFHCSVPGHKESGMIGHFTVVEAGAAAQPESDEGTAETTEEAPAGDGGSVEAITIETHDNFSFEPKEVDVVPGQVVKVHNTGFLPHDLVVDEWNIGTAQLNTDQEEEITIPADAEVGSIIDFHCSVPGHKESGMVGKFTIVAGSADAAPAPAETEEASPEADEDEATAEAPAGDGGAVGEPIVIEAHDNFSFEPKEVEVTPGQTIKLVNTGFLPHDLVVDDWNVGTEELGIGGEGEFVIPDDVEVGSTVDFHCSVPGHKESGMVGKFTVVAGSTDAAPAETEESADATAEAPAGDGGTGDVITIEALDSFKFEPKEVEVMPGQTIKLVNTGFLPHDLVVDDWNVGTEELGIGGEGEFVIPDDAEVGSTVDFHCSVPGHKESGMVGKFIVVAGGGGTGESAPEAAGTPVPASVHAVTVVGTKWQFEPAEFEIAPGGVITFQNNTGMLMGLSAEEWNKSALQPMIKSIGDGDSAEFTVPDDAEIGAEIEFKSNLSEAAKQGMVGKITIVAGDEGTPVGSRRSRRSFLASVFAAR